MMTASSQALMQMFYNLVVKSQITNPDSLLLDTVYKNITNKLVHFVMTKGWNEFMVRVKDSRSQQNDSIFTNDIYR